jgi:hypothetical protein
MANLVSLRMYSLVVLTTSTAPHEIRLPRGLVARIIQRHTGKDRKFQTITQEECSIPHLQASVRPFVDGYILIDMESKGLTGRGLDFCHRSLVLRRRSVGLWHLWKAMFPF